MTGFVLRSISDQPSYDQKIISRHINKSQYGMGERADIRKGGKAPVEKRLLACSYLH